MKLQFSSRHAATALAAALYVATPFAFATDKATLDNGAEVAITLDTPVQDQEYRAPAVGGPGATIDVAIDGLASIGEGDPAVAIAFVVDVSGSTQADCEGGTGTSILGCEKQAVLNVLSDPNITNELYY